MKRLATLFTQSYQELKKLRTVTVCGMMAAIAIALSAFASIEIGNYIKIGFSGIPNRIVDYLFGPVVGGCFGGALDIIKYLVKPTGVFFPGFTFDAILAGLIYGSFMYKKPLSLKRVLIAKLVVVLICNIFFNTLWISILYGKAFLALLPARLLKNAVMWPIDSLILFMVSKMLHASGIFQVIYNKN